MTTAGLETTADAVEADDFVLDGLSVRFRQPNADDLRAVATCTDLESARALLIDRCVLEASEDGSPLATGELPAAVIEELSERVSRIDPRAEILLDLRCPACEGGWELHFDIVSFVWSELCTRVERLFLEVDALAYAYGWSERDILAMSDVRRRRYLEEVG